MRVLVINPAGLIVSLFVFALCMALGVPVWWSLAIGLGWWPVSLALLGTFIGFLTGLDKALVKTGYYRWATRRRLRRRRKKAARRSG